MEAIARRIGYRGESPFRTIRCGEKIAPAIVLIAVGDVDAGSIIVVVTGILRISRMSINRPCYNHIPLIFGAVVVRVIVDLHLLS